MSLRHHLKAQRIPEMAKVAEAVAVDDGEYRAVEELGVVAAEA